MTSSFKSNTTKYKKSEISSSAYLPFEDSTFVSGFKSQFEDDYLIVLNRMHAFFQQFVDMESTSSTKSLAKNILNTILNDDSISESELFYVGLKGKGYTKNDLRSVEKIYFQPFMLGVWAYIIFNRPDNTVGSQFFEFIHSDENERLFMRGAWRYSEDYNRSSCAVITLHEDDIQFKAPIDTIDGHESNYDYYKKYLGKIQGKYLSVKTFLYNDTPRPFYEFYVCNRIGVHIPRRFMRDLDAAFFEHGPSIENATAQKLMKCCSNYIILTGTGGLGKSMMMRHLLLDSLSNYDTYHMLPIFITLKDYDGKFDNLLDLIFDNVENYCDIDHDTLERTLANGEALILLDGLDEVKSAYIEKFEKQLETFSDRYSGNMFIISSRPYSSFVSFSRFTVVQLMSFSKAQALELIDKLEFRPDEPGIKEKFYKELDSRLYETHKEFTANPLLLTIMLMTFEQFAEVPSKMHIFYREAYLALSQKHDANKGAYKRSLKTGLSADRFNDYFAEFCSRTYVDEKFELSEEEFAKYFNELHEKNNHPEEKVNASDFLYDLCSNMCLVFQESNHYFFTHRSFQEYFCALYFSKQKDKYLEKIGSIFEKSSSNTRGDKTFAMLYDMIPDKVDEYIFLPFLEKLFKKCDSTDNPYLAYLSKCYSNISYAWGITSEHEEEMVTTLEKPTSFILSFIISTTIKRIPYANNALPVVDDFIQTKFYLVDIPSEDGEDSFKELYPIRLRHFDRLFDSTNERFKDEEVVGYEILLDMPKLIQNKDKYPELISALSNDNFVLKDEYNRLRCYYEKLCLKRKPEKSDSLFDFFA